LDSKTEELQQIVSSAISLVTDRGDLATVTVVDFLPTGETEAASGASFMDIIGMHLGSLLNALGMIVAAILFAVLGIKPLLAFLGNSSSGDGAAPGLPPAIGGGDLPDFTLDDSFSPDLALPDPGAMPSPLGEPEPLSSMDTFSPPDGMMEEPAGEESKLRQQLQQMVEQSEERTVVALRHWMQQDQRKTV
ncbi:MAG: hypothetical protein AAF412_13795, partial [Pseudomonadota bacterium]